MEEQDKTKKANEPELGMIGEAGGTAMPSIAGGLIYNPDTITLKTYMEMEDDAQIKAVLTLIKAPLVGVVWSITCKDPDIKTFCTNVLEELWDKLIRSMLNSLNFGNQSFEKIWKKDGKMWILYDLVDLHPGSVTFRTEKGEFVEIEQFTTKGTVKIPAEKSFVFTNEKRFGNLYGRSRLRSAYQYWFMDKYTYDFENIYFERFAMPIIVGEAPPGRTQTGSSATSTESNIDSFLSKISNLRNKSAIVLPSEVDPVTKNKKWDVRFLEAQRRGADYKQRHEYLDLMKARAIFAPELVFSAPYAGSSYALAREHASIFMSAEEAILKEVQLHINRYILKQLVEYNFGSDAPKATWEFESISPEVKTMLRDLIMAMVAGDIVRPDPEWIANTLGLRLKEDKGKLKEKELKSAVQDKMLSGIKTPEEAEPGEEGEESEEGEDLQAAMPTTNIASKTNRLQNLLAMLGQLGKSKNIPNAGVPTLTPENIAEQVPEGIGNRRSLGAFRRWATKPKSKQFKTGRSWEKEFNKQVFDDIQNHYLFGTRRKLEFNEETGEYVKISEKHKELGLFRKILRMVKNEITRPKL